MVKMSPRELLPSWPAVHKKSQQYCFFASFSISINLFLQMPGGNPHHQGNPTRPPVNAVEKDFLAGKGSRPGNAGGQPIR